MLSEGERLVPVDPTLMERRGSGEPVYVIPGVSMAVLAQGTGMTRACISRIFSAKPEQQRKSPSIHSVSRIAEFLEMTVDDTFKLIREWQTGKRSSV